MSQTKESHQYKLVLLGESGVGKSNLVLQFVKGQFAEGKESTIGGTPPATRTQPARIVPVPLSPLLL